MEGRSGGVCWHVMACLLFGLTGSTALSTGMVTDPSYVTTGYKTVDISSSSTASLPYNYDSATTATTMATPSIETISSPYSAVSTFSYYDYNSPYSYGTETTYLTNSESGASTSLSYSYNDTAKDEHSSYATVGLQSSTTVDYLFAYSTVMTSTNIYPHTYSVETPPWSYSSASETYGASSYSSETYWPSSYSSETYWHSSYASETYWPSSSASETYWPSSSVSQTSWPSSYSSETYWPSSSASETYWPSSYASETYWPFSSVSQTSWPSSYSSETYWPSSSVSQTSWPSGYASETYWSSSSASETYWPSSYSSETYWHSSYASETYWPSSSASETYWPSSSVSQTSWPSSYSSETYWPSSSASETYWHSSYSSETYWPSSSASETYWPSSYSSETYWHSSYASETYWPSSYSSETYWHSSYASETYWPSSSASETYWPSSSVSQTSWPSSYSSQTSWPSSYSSQTSWPSSYASETYWPSSYAYETYGPSSSASETYGPYSYSSETYWPFSSASETYWPSSSASETYGPSSYASETYWPSSSASETYWPSSSASETYWPSSYASETYWPSSSASETYWPSSSASETYGPSSYSSETIWPSSSSSETYWHSSYTSETFWPSSYASETYGPSSSVSQTSWPSSYSSETYWPSSYSSQTSWPSSSASETYWPSSSASETYGPSSSASETYGPSSYSSETYWPSSSASETYWPSSSASETSWPSSYASETYWPSSYASETYGPSSYASETYGPSSYSSETSWPSGYASETYGPSSYSSETIWPSSYSSETYWPSSSVSQTSWPSSYSSQTSWPSSYSSQTSWPSSSVSQTSWPSSYSSETSWPSSYASETYWPSSYASETYGPSSYASETYGPSSYASETYGPSSYSSETYWPSSYASETYGPSSSTSETYGPSSYSSETSWPSGYSSETHGPSSYASEIIWPSNSASETHWPSSYASETYGPSSYSSETYWSSSYASETYWPSSYASETYWHSSSASETSWPSSYASETYWPSSYYTETSSPYTYSSVTTSSVYGYNFGTTISDITSYSSVTVTSSPTTSMTTSEITSSPTTSMTTSETSSSPTTSMTSSETVSSPTSSALYSITTSSETSSSPTLSVLYSTMTTSETFSSPTSSALYSTMTTSETVSSPTSSALYSTMTTSETSNSPTSSALYSTMTTSETVSSPTSSALYSTMTTSETVSSPTSSALYSTTTSSETASSPTSSALYSTMTSETASSPTSSALYSTMTPSETVSSPTSSALYSTTTSSETASSPTSSALYSTMTTSETVSSPTSSALYSTTTSSETSSSPTSSALYSIMTTSETSSNPTSSALYSTMTSLETASGPTSSALYSTTTTSESTSSPTTSMTTSETTSSPTTSTTTSEVPTGIYPDTCRAGTGYRWVHGACTACDGTNEYNDGSSNVCQYCEYNTNNSNACNSGDGAKTATIGQQDICISVIFHSEICSVTSAMTLTSINIGLSEDVRSIYLNAFPSSSGLCGDEQCQNILATAAKKGDLCRSSPSVSAPDGSSTLNFNSTIKVCLYDVDEFVNTGSGVYRRAEEMYLESISDFTNFASTPNRQTTFMNNTFVLEPPTSLTRSSVSSNENRVMVVFVQTSKSWNSNFQTTTSQQYSDFVDDIAGRLPKMLGTFGTSSNFLYASVQSVAQYDTTKTEVILQLVSRAAINSALITAVRELFVDSHSAISGGSFGDSGFSLEGEINLYESVAAQQSGTSAVSWCSSLESLAQTKSLTICSGTDTCTDSNLWYTCTPEDTSQYEQREFYPWGAANGDSMIEPSSSPYYYWYYDFRSELISVPSGVPFGDRKTDYIQVYPNGVITFQSKSSYSRWWNPTYPYLSYYYRYSYYSSRERWILAPFWHRVNRYENGKVYYQLYTQPGSDGGSTASNPNYATVLTRAQDEVQETLGVANFTATIALVVTWDKVQPTNWWWWLCRYYNLYSPYSWWNYYYGYYYYTYCFQSLESNTFQSVYVTDGEKAFAIVTYKAGEMNWAYDRYRPIDIGFAGSSWSLNFDYRYTDLTTKLDTNTFNTGRYGTWIQQVGEVENPDAKCSKWYTSNLYMVTDPSVQTHLDNLYKCPCTRGRLGYQFTWHSYKWLGDYTYMYCYYLGRKSRDRRIQNNPFNKVCCYQITYFPWSWSAWRDAPYIGDYTDSNAGHIVTYNPSYWGGYYRESQEADFEPKKWCCEWSSSPATFCPLFEAVRPVTECSNDVDWFLGRAMGDPHITTLDDLTYTFNGRGEYTMLQVDSESFTLQARTDVAINSQGQNTTATVFVAFAVQENTDTHFQVQLNDDRTRMIIIANGQDITNSFYASENYTLSEDDLSVERDDRDSDIRVSASFTSIIGFEAYIGMNNLEFSVRVPTGLKGLTKGLLGNYNDDDTDEFILPDGTQLTQAQTDTERKIFENFGSQWQVTTSSTVFTYETGETALDYQYPTFEPIFREEVNATVLAAAETFCGGDENLACVFDYIATQDEAFASATQTSADDLASETQSLNNNLPVLTLATTLNAQNRWQVTHGQAATLQFTATDDDGQTVTFELAQSASGVSVDSANGTVTYTPDYDTPVRIGVRASDSIGKTAPIYVKIIVCTGCNGNGECDNATPRNESQQGSFMLATCNCLSAWEGTECTVDVDGCEDEPCAEGQNCTDLAAADQGNSTVGYVCGDCQDGFQLDIEGTECIDINECIENGTAPVCGTGSNCTNSVGSYDCVCLSGYRVDSADPNLCNDIDECAERIHDCNEICDNIAGGYNCSCYGGYNLLNNDGYSCSEDTSCTATCDDINSFCLAGENGAADDCACITGYLWDGSACQDVDECDGVKPCSQACTNAIPGYTCSCYSGYTLNADGVNCDECETSYYGVNCAFQCQCNGHGTCDSQKGCVCDAGWTGTNCITDVNECDAVVDKKCTGNQQLCSNTLGSYTCYCADGYTMGSDGICADIDECESVLTHTCDLATQNCENNQGSYSCPCLDGYSRDAAGTCSDIDECSVGTHICEQQCENTVGSYNCKCLLGYSLDNDRASCVQKSDPCEGVANRPNCSQICTIDEALNQAVCACNAGYGLVGTELCQDINECEYDYLNLCEYTAGCINSQGGYNCSCEVGSYLDNDGRSCVDCGSGTWGENCVNSCNCDATGAATCDMKYGCVCNSGFTGTHCSEDIDECVSGSVTCGEAERCVNTPGSAECLCIDGYVLSLGTCQDLNECAVAANNNCSQVCSNTPGSYQCSCYSGYQGDNCQDIDECSEGLVRCQEGCENTDGSYRCTCPDGLKLNADGMSCDVDETCISSGCSDYCAVTGGVDTCYCDLGRELDLTNSSNCIDIDYCANVSCTGTCTNDGTYFTCTCSAGEYLDTDGLTCKPCVEGKYGVDCQNTCDCNGATTDSCNKVDGTCECLDGWKDDDCSSDVDECDVDPTTCDSTPNSYCVNTAGSHVCRCNIGFYSTNPGCAACTAWSYGENCAQTCNCTRENTDSCDTTDGTCNCASGYTGSECQTDIDECAQSNDCTLANRTNWVCTNLPGSYECGCTSGYEDVNSVCTDIDECAAAFTNECNQNCSNAVGNYTCSCNSGYLLASDQRTCEDIDECTAGSHQCGDVCATNTDGSYTCGCNTGRLLDTSSNYTCYNAFSVYHTLTFAGLSSAGLNLAEKAGADYANTKNRIEPFLRSHVSGRISGHMDTSITDLRSGSIIVDYTSSFNKDTNPDAASHYTDLIIDMATNGISINGSIEQVTILVGGLSVTSTTDKCVIMIEVNGCDGLTCYIDSSGSAACRSEDDDSEDVALIVGLAVGLPLGVALIFAIGFALWYKSKYMDQRRVISVMEHYNEEDRSPSPNTLLNFTVDGGHTSLVGLDNPKSSEKF